MRLILYIIFAVSAFTSDKGSRPRDTPGADENFLCSNNTEAALISSIAHLLTEISEGNSSGNRTLTSKGSTFINNLNVGIQNKRAENTKNSTFSTSEINKENIREKIYSNDFLIYFVSIGIFFSIVLISVVLYLVLTKLNRYKNKPTQQTYFSPSDKYSEVSGLAPQIVQE